LSRPGGSLRWPTKGRSTKPLSRTSRVTWRTCSVGYGGDVNEQIAALLHEVLEDTEVSESDLRRNGVPEATLVIVKLLTKVDGEPKTDYNERIRQHEPSRGVKLLGDIASNSDPNRLALLPHEMRIRLTKKYAEATRHLTNGTSHN
jgi:hypothetical protein